MNTTLPLIIFVFTSLIIVLPFEIWGLLETGSRAKILSWSYRRLPRFITKRIWFQSLRWKYFYGEAETMFWGRCFERKHNWEDIGVGIHCKNCRSFIPNYKLSGVRNFKLSRDVFETIT